MIESIVFLVCWLCGWCLFDRVLHLNNAWLMIGGALTFVAGQAIAMDVRERMRRARRHREWIDG